MLQKLNERIQGVVAWIIIILVTITFMLFGIDYYMQSRHDSTTQVEVNDEPITKQAFELSYRRTRQFREPAQLDVSRENQLKQQVLDDMILNSVSVQAARLNGFEVNAAQANNAILSIPQFQQDGHFSTNRYAQALNGAFFTPESFQQEVRQGMLLNQQRFAMIGTAFALPSELKQFVRLYMQTRDYDYLQIPALKFIKDAKVSDDEITNYYQNHKQVFLTPEKVSIDYIRLSMQNIKNSITISPTQVKQYYDENQANYLTPTQWQVASMDYNLPANATSEEVGKLQEQVNRVYANLQKAPSQFVLKGSDFPWITAGQADFDKALIQLTTPGQISPPVKSATGFKIYKLIAYKPSAVKPFSEVQADIKEQLLVELAQAKYTQILEQLSDLSYQTPDSLQPVADTLKLPIEHSEPFSHHGGESPITKNEHIIRAAFSHDVLKFGNNSEPIQFENDSVVVLRVNKHIPAMEKTLVDVKLLIAEKLARKKAAAEAKQFGQELLKTEQNKIAQEKLIAASQLQWRFVAQAGRDADIAPQAVNELAFNIPVVGAEAGRELSEGDYVVVHLKKINDGNFDSLDKEQVSSIRQQIEANYGLMDYDLYINGQMSQAKIVKH